MSLSVWWPLSSISFHPAPVPRASPYLERTTQRTQVRTYPDVTFNSNTPITHQKNAHIYIYASIYMWASVGHLSSWNPPRAARTGSSLVIWEVTAAKTHSKQNYSCLFLKKAYITHSQTNFIQSPDPPGLSINPQPWSAHFCPMLRQSKAWPVSVLLGLALALHKPGAPSSLGLPSVSPIALISTCMDKLSS